MPTPGENPSMPLPVQQKPSVAMRAATEAQRMGRWQLNFTSFAFGFILAAVTILVATWH